MNTQVQLLNSLFRLVGRVNSELVGSMDNAEGMIRELYNFHSSIQYTKSKQFLKMSYRSVYFLNT